MQNILQWNHAKFRTDRESNLRGRERRETITCFRNLSVSLVCEEALIPWKLEGLLI